MVYNGCCESKVNWNAFYRVTEAKALPNFVKIKMVDINVLFEIVTKILAPSSVDGLYLGNRKIWKLILIKKFNK